jgi:hypothetical protein
MSMKIAVVIPCFNHASELEQALASLVRQTRQPDEVVVVDDASIDDVGSIVSGFKDRLNVKMERLTQNLGAPAARNRGAELTTSPYLLFMDADVVLEPEALEAMAGSVEDNPEADIIYSDFKWGWKKFTAQAWNISDLRRLNFIHTTSLIKRAAFPGFDETLKKFQDWDLWLTMAERESYGVRIERCLFSVKPRATGMSSWLPSFVHRLPWPIFGWLPKEIKKYRAAEKIIRDKHQPATSIVTGKARDLRIVVVSWNVGDLLERCLKSLPEACAGLDWECVVVDNASKDGSPQIVEGLAEYDKRFSLLTNAENLGFAKACNQGAAGNTARYVLFLNPDTESPSESLVRLVALADERPKAGILGPKLVYPDGRTQASVRRFPAFWDQVAIVLKLSHFMPWLPVLRRYFGADIDLEKEQRVDQVMGACFLVRKELVDRKLGYDERYFIWMEEVDFCKTARTNGWDVEYLPQVSVVHHLGQSFGKEFQPKRQKYYLTSLKKYFAKWHPGWQAWAISALAPIGMAAVWALNFSTKKSFVWIIGLLLVETVSFIGYGQPAVMSVACVTVGIIVVLLAYANPPAALGILFLELLTGSKGYLLSLNVGSVGVSLRIVLFAAFFAGWSLNVVQHRAWRGASGLMVGRWHYAALVALVIFAFNNGILNGNQKFIFADANAWLDLALLVPVLDVARRYPKELRSVIPLVAFIGLGWTAIKTFAVEYVSAHGLDTGRYVYLWIRKTGVGEVTRVTGNAWRVFFQSHVFFIAAWLVAAAWTLFSDKGPSASLRSVQDDGRRGANLAWWMMAISVFIIGISLSRSFWLGTAAGVVGLGVLGAGSWGLGKIKRIITAAFVGVALIAAALMFPLPPVSFVSLGDIVASRSDMGEAAAVSRWQLLPKLWEKIQERPITGSGFGATVTYASKDPRVIEKTGGTGIYETYAFEWGWLDFWLKFGILGIPLMLWIVVWLGWRIWKLDEPRWLRSGAVVSLAALAVLHFFTPYLNHPLGFAFIFLGEGLIETRRRLANPAA